MNPNHAEDHVTNPVKNEQNASFLRFPIRAGQVTGLPKDPTLAPHTVRLSATLHYQSQEALNRTKKSGNEWGYFIHVGEEGDLQAGPLREGTPDSWISLDEYLPIKQQDATIQGLMHVHLKGATAFSDSNIGFFLETNAVIYKCTDPQGNYLLMIRTELTEPPRLGLFEETLYTYRAVARDKTRQYIWDQDLRIEEATQKAVVDAMIEVCKQYNIALYIGTHKQPAEKVV